MGIQQRTNILAQRYRTEVDNPASQIEIGNLNWTGSWLSGSIWAQFQI
jgi:hypothetical protein